MNFFPMQHLIPAFPGYSGVVDDREALLAERSVRIIFTHRTDIFRAEIVHTFSPEKRVGEGIFIGKLSDGREAAIVDHGPRLGYEVFIDEDRSGRCRPSDVAPHAAAPGHHTMD